MTQQKIVSVRVAPDEHRAVKLAATTAGLSMNDWARRLLVEAAEASRPAVVKLAQGESPK